MSFLCEFRHVLSDHSDPLVIKPFGLVGEDVASDLDDHPAHFMTSSVPALLHRPFIAAGVPQPSLRGIPPIPEAPARSALRQERNPGPSHGSSPQAVSNVFYHGRDPVWSPPQP